MKDKKYKHSFARRLTRRVMLVLLVMMGALAYFIYHVSSSVVVSVNGSNFHSSMQASAMTISNAMSEVNVAVNNNIKDIEDHLSQPDVMEVIMKRIVEHNPRIRSCGISFIDSYYPKKGRAFCPYAWRDDSLGVKLRPANEPNSDYLASEWFTDAVAKDSAYWSQPFFESGDAKTPLVAYMYPIHDRQGKVVAILGADLSLDFVTELLNEQDRISVNEAKFIFAYDDRLHSYLLTHDGTYITHPDKRRILKGNFFGHIKDNETPGKAEEMINNMSEGKKSSHETNNPILFNRSPHYLFYRPLEGTDWIIAQTVTTITLDMFGILVGLAMALIIAFILIITFFVCQLTIRHMAKPLNLLADTADEVAQGQLNAALPDIDSHDEIHQLRDSFDNMQHSLSKYIEELKVTTSAKASIESELKIAHNIQMSMLPKTYPAFPERHDIDIYGQLTPAKAVGGDLYDFFIRDEKLFFCIGDVSGKGVPASLVMAVTRSLFRNISAYTQAPDQILIALNEALSSNNETGMFVTLFLGVLDLASGHMSYANAAHNPPLVLSGDNVSDLACDSNIPAGVMEGWQFSVQHLDMKTGDCIFLYTDGLNEAEDISHNQLEMERVRQVLSTTINKPQTLIEAMTSSVKMFVGNAEQSDDLTMLAIKYTLQ
jgi:sigma-B regulation protein RsbU (phosphoserine phosphatase)